MSENYNYKKDCRDYDYEKNNIGYDEQYPDGGIKCNNFLLCKTVLPNWWIDCKKCYICTNCNIMFGTWKSGDIQHTGKGVLPIHNDKDCPVCLEITTVVEQPRCNHFACINCFKRCYYGDDDIENMPIFPYPEIEDEYYDDYIDEDNEKWANYPLIKEYNLLYDLWLEEKENKYINEEYLRMCPICRK